jgi:hypothetical protein
MIIYIPLQAAAHDVLATLHKFDHGQPRQMVPLNPEKYKIMPRNSKLTASGPSMGMAVGGNGGCYLINA